MALLATHATTILRLGGVAGGLLLALACGNVPDLPIVADPCAAWPEPGLYRMTVGEAWTRQPLVYVPPDEGRRHGVIMLHGAGGSADRIIDLTNWRPDADLLGFTAVFPQGTGTVNGFTWNAGSCCGYAESTQQDDVAFLEATALAMREQLCVDRLLAAGHSNGGMMIHRWTCDGSNPGQGPDAFVSSAGPLLLDGCEGAATPIMTWHGDADPRVPYDGGLTEEGETFPAAPDAFAEVRARNGCTDAPPTVTVDGDTTCETWDCAAPTTFCTVAGWTHEWPGGPADRSDGPVIEDVAVDWFFDLFPADTDAGDTDLPADTDGPEEPADTDPADTDPADTDPAESEAPADSDPAESDPPADSDPADTDG